jgi:hypothetical protein
VTHLYVITFNNAQRRNVSFLAACDKISIERWVARAALLEVGRRLKPEPSPRNQQVARKRPSFNSPALVACPHCQIPTRPVSTCDNCERAL